MPRHEPPTADAVPGHPLVSIIVPSYNQGRFLGETLDSIFAQDYQPLEVLVMDGESKDEAALVENVIFPRGENVLLDSWLEDLI